MFSRFFIDRPIFAVVISLFIALAGLAAMRVLPIAQYPEIAPPVVQVRAVYPGASATVLEQTVAAPIENAINGVEDMLYMSSTSSSEGVVNIAITFNIGVDVDKAALNVNNQTGTSDARAEIPNPEGRVRPGQFVRAILRGAERPAAITVPQRAVMEGAQGKMVYLLSPDNKAMPRPVTVGDWTGTDWIITSGLAPGDKVIVDGLAKIFFPGAPVQVGDPNAPPPGAPGKGDSKGGPPPKK